jgi:hypothetical protein
MPLFEKRIIIPPARFDQRKLEFQVKDRARVGNTIMFRNATIIAIAQTSMTIQYEDCTDTVDLSLTSIKQHGTDDELANGLSGLGGCSSSGGRSRSGKRSKTVSKPTEPAELYLWVVDVITSLFVKTNTGTPTSVLSRTFMVYDSNMLIGGEWVPQEEATINMLETPNDPIAGDVWACAHHMFLHDLFLATTTESLKQRMLGEHEPVCLGETVDERQATIEEWDDRQSIYAHHVDTQATLAATAAAPAAAAAVAAAAPAPAEAPHDAPAADADADASGLVT